MTAIAIARTYLRAGNWDAETDSVTLDYESRFLRRRRLVTAGGMPLLVDLAETVSIEDGDALVIEGGGLVSVQAASEPLIEVCAQGEILARLAWHVGNRHTPAQILPGALRLRRDRVMADMLIRLGAVICEIEAPFTPEGGAYGHGRTHGHHHGGAEDDPHHHHRHAAHATESG